jgi:hypothetical protein
MRQARPREHAAGWPQRRTWSASRSRSRSAQLAGHGRRKQPVERGTCMTGRSLRGAVPLRRATRGATEAARRRRPGGRSGGRCPECRPGGRYLKYRPPLGPFCPSDGRCAGQIIVCRTREPSSSPAPAGLRRGSWMAEWPRRPGGAREQR